MQTRPKVYIVSQVTLKEPRFLHQIVYEAELLCLEVFKKSFPKPKVTFIYESPIKCSFS